MLEQLVHLCVNLQSQQIRGLRTRRLDIEQRSEDNKVEIGLTATLPKSFTIQNIIQQLTKEQEIALGNHNLRSYPIDLSGIESCRFTLIVTDVDLGLASCAQFLVTFGEISQISEIDQRPCQSDQQSLMTFTLFTSKAQASTLPGLLQTCNRWSPQISTTL